MHKTHNIYSILLFSEEDHNFLHSSPTAFEEHISC